MLAAQGLQTKEIAELLGVRTAPSPLPDWVEQDGPIGHAHAGRRSLKKTNINPEEDASRTSIRRRLKAKKRHVQTG